MLPPVFPRLGGEGEGRRAQSRAHALGLASRRRPKANRPAGQGGCMRHDPGADARPRCGMSAMAAAFMPQALSGLSPCYSCGESTAGSCSLIGAASRCFPAERRQVFPCAEILRRARFGPDRLGRTQCAGQAGREHGERHSSRVDHRSSALRRKRTLDRGRRRQADRWRPLGQRQKSIVPQSAAAYVRHSISAAAIITARSGRAAGRTRF
jgi:hypothetical protein